MSPLNCDISRSSLKPFWKNWTRRRLRPGIFDSFFRNNFLPEVVSDIISGLAIEYVGLDVPVKFGDSRSNHSRYIRAAHFVIDERRTKADGGCGNRQQRHMAFCLKCFCDFAFDKVITTMMTRPLDDCTDCVRSAFNHLWAIMANAVRLFKKMSRQTCSIDIFVDLQPGCCLKGRLFDSTSVGVRGDGVGIGPFDIARHWLPIDTYGLSLTVSE